jgi:hydroxylamine reductase (hybrid-cluster protein)
MPRLGATHLTTTKGENQPKPRSAQQARHKRIRFAFGAASAPLSYDIAWYEQKAVAVLLALLFLGVKVIRLGPTLPAFLSPNVAKVLVDKFDIKPIGTVEEDIAAMMAGA